jgi:predicted glycosyltransferase
MFLHPDHFTPDPEVRRRYLEDAEALTVVRFSAHDASHDRDIDGISPQGREAVLERLLDHGPTLVSIERQGLHLHRTADSHIQSSNGAAGASEPVKVAPEHFHDLLATAELFVGDSQSVAAEAAILGVPSLRLSGFTGRAFYLGVLESYGLMRNFLPGQEDLLLAELDATLANLPARRASSRLAADRLNLASEDLAGWFVQVVKDHSVLHSH